MTKGSKMHQETQASIAQWAQETFGPEGSLLRVAVRANEELVELLRCIASGAEPEKIVEEVADIVIVLCRFAHRIEAKVEYGSYTNAFTPMQNALAIHDNLNALMGASCKLIEGTHIGWLMPAFERALQDTASRASAIVEKISDSDLWSAVDAKMAINRQRKWRLDGTGHGYSIKD